MKICFNINFKTVWGQKLYIFGSIPELGNWEATGAKEMCYEGEGNWGCEIELPNEEISFEYRYFMSSNGALTFEEWERNHQLTISNVNQSYVIIDHWLSKPWNSAFYSSAFTRSLFAHESKKIDYNIKSKKKIVLNAFAPTVDKGQSLALLGNQSALGNWDASKALEFSCEKFPEWTLELDASKLKYPIEYKLCIINDHDKSIARWEVGENRTLNMLFLKANQVGVVSSLQFNDDYNWKCAGLVIPIFSLRSKKSFGIGDFMDLQKMVDWAKATNQKIIQTLPINDTTMTRSWVDSYPYNAISIYALHPLYLSLDAMGTLKDKERKQFFQGKQKELNDLCQMDYELVDRYKWEFFREIFAQDGEKTIASKDFARFFQANEEWLVPYAAYSYLRDENNTPNFNAWGQYAKFDRAEIEKLCQPGTEQYNEIAIYYFLQYHLDKQLKKARDYAHENGVILKGDIPIGISNVSIEAWTEPGYFNMNTQAGAPPDDFSINGQNWGFPTYNWQAMEADDYSWWKKRFRKMADYFDAYRIDHILGFFRIWQIPLESVEGLLGTFNPALPFNLDEIYNVGFNFGQDDYTKAKINQYHLNSFFGEYTDEVKQLYLDRCNHYQYVLKEDFNTQRKIKNYFADKTDNKNKWICGALTAICNEVLFIEDKDRPGHFHPRISAASSCRYRDLDISDKNAFDYLYWNYYFQKHDYFWKEQAFKHLVPLINSTDMLVCGEDLGMIPHSVPEVMNQLQILSLEIERMPKDPKVLFTPIRHNPYLSVCTTSTHDMSTIRGWWREDRGKTQRYYNEVLWKRDGAPEDCTPEICEIIVRNHLSSTSMLTIIPFQDWLSIDGQLRNPDIDGERINVPANSRHYWRYRMHLSIEDLLKADELNERIRRLIAETGR